MTLSSGTSGLDGFDASKRRGRQLLLYCLLLHLLKHQTFGCNMSTRCCRVSLSLFSLLYPHVSIALLSFLPVIFTITSRFLSLSSLHISIFYSNIALLTSCFLPSFFSLCREDEKLFLQFSRGSLVFLTGVKLYCCKSPIKELQKQNRSLCIGAAVPPSGRTMLLQPKETRTHVYI